MGGQTRGGRVLKEVLTISNEAQRASRQRATRQRQHRERGRAAACDWLRRSQQSPAGPPGRRRQSGGVSTA